MTKTESARQWARNYFEKEGAWPSGYKIAKAVGMDARGACRVVAKLKRDQPAATDTGGDPEPFQSNPKLWRADGDILANGGTLTFSSQTKYTLDEAIAFLDLDLEMWEIKKWKPKAWPTTMKLKDKDGVHHPTQIMNYGFALDIEPLVPNPLSLSLKSLEKRLEKYAPKPTVDFSNISPLRDLLMEIDLFDTHIGKLAWGKEIDRPDYNLDEGSDIFIRGAEQLLSEVDPERIAKFVIPIGNDFYHIENYKGLTSGAGHILDVDSRLPKILEVGEMAAVKVIDMLQKIAPVDVLWVPGNHDRETSYGLCRTLRAWFKDIPHVEVDVSPTQRKYFRWGNILIGETHGDKEKPNSLPGIMLQERKKEMAECKYCEWRIGHLHKKEEFVFRPYETHAGVVIRRISALSQIDAWHYEMGHIDANRIAEAFLCHKKRGVINHLYANLD
jgi:hypothetical protein